MRRLLVLLLLAASSAFAVTEELTPLRIAQTFKASAPATSPGSCAYGKSPNVIANNTGANYRCDVSNAYVQISTGAHTGSGTAGKIAKWTGSAALGNSRLTDDGTDLLYIRGSGGFDAAIDTSLLVTMDHTYRIPDYVDDPFFPTAAVFATSITDNAYSGTNTFNGPTNFNGTIAFDLNAADNFIGRWGSGLPYSFEFAPNGLEGLGLYIDPGTASGVDALSVHILQGLHAGDNFAALYDSTGTPQFELRDDGIHSAPLKGNADTATAFAADPSNCSTGSAAAGVNAAGEGQGCTLIPVVSNTAYDATTWDGNSDAATKDAIRDKFEIVVAAIPSAYGSTPETVSLSAGSAGSSSAWAKGDHRHLLDVAVVPTWTGVHTYSAQDVHNAGVSLGASGFVASAVANSGTNVAALFQQSVKFTGSRALFGVDWNSNSAGAHQRVFEIFGSGVGGLGKEMRLYYDASNYFRTTVSSLGVVTMQAVGTSPGVAYNSAGTILFTASTGISLTATTSTVTLDTPTTTATGDFKLSTVGSGAYVKEGTNATMGTATLVAGVIVVNTTKVTANSRVFLTEQVLGTVALPCALAVTARTAATSFTITSACVTDTSAVAWLIVEPS